MNKIKVGDKVRLKKQEESSVNLRVGYLDGRCLVPPRIGCTYTVVEVDDSFRNPIIRLDGELNVTWARSRFELVERQYSILEPHDV